MSSLSGNNSLEDHTNEFLELAHIVHYPNESLCFLLCGTQWADENVCPEASVQSSVHLWLIELIQWLIELSATEPVPTLTPLY